MTSFEDAIRIAKKQLNILQHGAREIKLEAALINEDDDVYEISFSYFMNSEDGVDIESQSPNDNTSDIFRLMSLMRSRKSYKTFLISKLDGQFKGFKNYQEA